MFRGLKIPSAVYYKLGVTGDTGRRSILRFRASEPWAIDWGEDITIKTSGSHCRFTLT